MGSRGLGQLAYDKAMRVQATSQADDVALEAQVKGEGHGLLTYALVREGLLGRKAAGAGGGLTLGGLLKYAEGRVPTLYAEVLGGTPSAARGRRSAERGCWWHGGPRWNRWARPGRRRAAHYGRGAPSRPRRCSITHEVGT